jgi:hypothetical protein
VTHVWAGKHRISIRVGGSLVVCERRTHNSRAYALVDRELYLPQVWADDTDRREEAGVPDDVEFATKGMIDPSSGRGCARDVDSR